MIAERNIPLAPYTSLKVGGPAELCYAITTYADARKLLAQTSGNIHVLGFGSNSLISDRGLSDTTVVWRGGDIVFSDNVVTVDAGVWWDDVVLAAIKHGLWGIELMSEIPSSTGAAVVGNIAAYGQQTSDSLLWIEVFDRKTNSLYRLAKDEIEFGYRQSSLQQEPHRIVMKVALQLSPMSVHTLKYDTALVIADELGIQPTTPQHARDIIIETRQRAGSIYHPEDVRAERTAGSFFKNPMVTIEQAKHLASFDETGKTLERILRQSTVHGGNAQRASAAHVLLAAGFHRGQTWGNVRLHEKHVLKIETLPGASATEVYNVSRDIIKTVKDSLNIDLEPEVKFLGEF